MYKPDFPYLGNQVIISSGRVTAHSKDDMVFLFGKKGIGISSPATVNLDANEAVVVASPLIQLGYQASEPVLLGRSTVRQLTDLLDALQTLSESLKNITWVPEKMADNTSLIRVNSDLLVDKIKTVKNNLNSTTCLSRTTFTN